MLGGEYEETGTPFKSDAAQKWVYLGRFLWSTVGSERHRVDPEMEFKNRGVFWSPDTGDFSVVQCQDLKLNLRPVVRPGWEALVDGLKKTRFTSLPMSHKVESLSVDEVVAAGWFWTGETNRTVDYQLLSLHKVTEVAGGLEVGIVKEMMVKLPSLEDCGLNKIWDPEGKKSASKLLSRGEVAVMQPKSLVLRQANGLHIKRENYGRSVKMEGKGSFEIVGE